MTEKPKVREAIVVEGRYDKNAVSQAVDAVILETEGFGLFSQRDRLALIRRLAAVTGVIVFTDPDSAGFLIRNHIKGAVSGGVVKHAYIPDIPGKERRKRAPSKEGKLGVEGVGTEAIIAALRRAGATFEDSAAGAGAAERREKLTKADFFRLGLTGTDGSAAKRAAVIKKLELPERLTANGLLEVLNVLYTPAEAEEVVKGIVLKKENNS